TAVILLSFIVSSLALPVPKDDPVCEGVLGCNNHGVCAGTLEEGLYCICDPGYFGLRCQLPDDEPIKQIKDVPCETMINCNDHGVCAGGVEDLHCECNPGWYGVRCQIPVQ
ncbi:hypothetical protein PENTCL1PPCAC_7544, partial [Pristionchus entomophagus]